MVADERDTIDMRIQILVKNIKCLAAVADCADMQVPKSLYLLFLRSYDCGISLAEEQPLLSARHVKEMGHNHHERISAQCLDMVFSVYVGLESVGLCTA